MGTPVFIRVTWAHWGPLVPDTETRGPAQTQKKEDLFLIIEQDLVNSHFKIRLNLLLLAAD